MKWLNNYRDVSKFIPLIINWATAAQEHGFDSYQEREYRSEFYNLGLKLSNRYELAIEILSMRHADLLEPLIVIATVVHVESTDFCNDKFSEAYRVTFQGAMLKHYKFLRRLLPRNKFSIDLIIGDLVEFVEKGKASKYLENEITEALRSIPADISISKLEVTYSLKMFLMAKEFSNFSIVASLGKDFIEMFGYNTDFSDTELPELVPPRDHEEFELYGKVAYLGGSSIEILREIVGSYPKNSLAPFLKFIRGYYEGHLFLDLTLDQFETSLDASIAFTNWLDEDPVKAVTVNNPDKCKLDSSSIAILSGFSYLYMRSFYSLSEVNKLRSRITNVRFLGHLDKEITYQLGK